MSGGGGGDIGPEIGTPACAKLILRNPLNSPVAKVISKLEKDDVLDLSLRSPKGPLVAVTADGEEAGSITSSALARLIQCILDGYEFVALVLRVDKGLCEVEVRP